MPSIKPEVVVNDDGSLNYIFPEGAHAVIPGPIQGDVVLADGTRVNVTPPILGFDNEAERDEVSDLIARRYVAEGHPDHDDQVPFVYNPQGAE